ncbi:MAG: transglutaminase-like domain-containing protein [Bacteroidales bacterium]
MNWTKDELAFFRKLDSPDAIQSFLDTVDYNPSYECRSPRWVIKRRKAHCFEGAIFAAAALRFLGYKPLLVDMKAHNDDDHVIAIFKVDNCWGAVAKSNFTTLRFREPVYRSVRELVMSYFDFFFNTAGEKTLRSYSLPLDLNQFNKTGWETTDDDLEFIGDKIESIRHFDVMTSEMIARLNHVSETVRISGLMGSNPEGLYKPTIQ